MEGIEKLRIEELRKLKNFFEQVEKDSRHDPMCIAGCFGCRGTFFGNTIQWNLFEIPYSAMKLIYEANRKNINNTLNKYSEEQEGEIKTLGEIAEETLMQTDIWEP